MHKILQSLLKARTVIISGHVRPDGDCIGSCLGMYHYIRDNYPEIDVSVYLEDVPSAYRILPGSEQIRTDEPNLPPCDLFIALDCSEKERLGRYERYFSQAGYCICIDHHISNTGYADENLIRADASSASEVLCDVLDSSRISEKAALALYTGIICDSGVFKYSCTSRHTMEMAGMLMEKGIPYTQIIDMVFYERTYTQAQVLGYCLQKSRLSCGGALISCVLTKEEMDRFGAVHGDLESIVSEMKLTKGTEVSLFLYYTNDGMLRVSLRSAGKVNVRAMAECYGGGGHTLASGATASGDPEDVIARIGEMLMEQLG